MACAKKKLIYPKNCLGQKSWAGLPKKTPLNIELVHGLLDGLKQAKFAFMTFVGFATSTSHPTWRGIRNLDIKSVVINVCDNQNQCHNVMTLPS